MCTRGDGNIYRRPHNGWDKYNNGSWSQVQGGDPRATGQGGATSADRSSNLSGETERGQASRTGSGADNMGQLERDRQARTTGCRARLVRPGAVPAAACAEVERSGAHDPETLLEAIAAARSQ
jgi:hypothetical protein